MILEFSIHDISSLSPIIPIIIGLIFWRHLKGNLTTIWIYCVLALSSDLIAYFQSAKGQSNIAIINVFVVIQTIIIGLYFVQQKGYGPKIRKGVFAVFIVSTFLTLLFLLIGYNDEKIQIEQLIITCISVMVFCFLYYWNLLQNQFHLMLWMEPGLYIVSGLLLYFVSTSIVFAAFYLFDENGTQNIWTIKLFAYILLNFLFGIGFIVAKKKMDG